MKGSALIIILVIICFLVILGMGGYIFFTSSKHTQQQSSETTSSVTPSIPIKDFAPSLPMSQKTSILIQLSDSSMVKYIVPKGEESVYTKNLPEGDHVVSTSP